MFFVCLFAFITGQVKTVLKDFVMYCLHALALDLVRGRCNSMLYLFLAVLPLVRASLVAQRVTSACNAGDLGLIPGSGRSPGEGNGNPLQYTCLGNPMDREAW